MLLFVSHVKMTQIIVLDVILTHTCKIIHVNLIAKTYYSMEILRIINVNVILDIQILNQLYYLNKFIFI